MSKTYRFHDPKQTLLFPPNIREWLPEGHLALLIDTLIRHADISGDHFIRMAGPVPSAVHRGERVHLDETALGKLPTKQEALECRNGSWR